MAELMPRVDTFGPLGDRHAHRDARPLRPPALGARAAPLASGQVLPEIQDPLRLGVDLLVEALVAGPHARVVGESDREPSLDAFGRPALPQGVLDWRHAAVYGVSMLANPMCRRILQMTFVCSLMRTTYGMWKALSSVASLVCCASMTLCCRLRVNRRNDSAHLLRGLPSDSFPVPYFMGGYAGGTKDTK